jgi:hypothetical protein
MKLEGGGGGGGTVEFLPHPAKRQENKRHENKLSRTDLIRLRI